MYIYAYTSVKRLLTFNLKDFVDQNFKGQLLFTHIGIVTS